MSCLRSAGALVVVFRFGMTLASGVVVRPWSVYLRYKRLSVC